MKFRIILCGLAALILMAGCSSKSEYSEAAELLTSDVWVSQESSGEITFLDSYVGNIAYSESNTYSITWYITGEDPLGYSITVRRKTGSLLVDDDYLLKCDGEIPVLVDLFWDTEYVRKCDLQ